ncbi:outer membrane protein transport protein [Pedobacter ginsengiterrae]|uniref:Outer membrane protein transport protein n=1 Tax=Pedobacter ginsengiterrae TaxID=871696 RepID=A0ABP7NNN5_9SPHI
MKLRSIFIVAGIVLASNSLYAQYTSDVLRFSQPEQGTTARFRGLGGAQTALGGDISSLSGNPAGLGFFTKSEFTFTPEFNNFKVGSEYLGNSLSDKKSKAGINQVGAVFYSPVNKAKGSNLNDGWVSVNFGIGYNKTNNFNQNITYGGKNASSSMADYFANIAGNTAPANLIQGSLEDMAYSNFLIEYDPAGYFPTTATNNSQQNTITRSGSQSEVNIGMAGNYGNKLYLGVSLGLTNINYTSDIAFTESGNNRTFPAQDPTFLNGTYSFGYNSIQQTKGNGVNAKLGLIYKPVNELRLGLNFTTPTWYSLTDNFSENLNTKFKRADGTNIPEYTNPLSNYNSEYSLRTPYKVSGGAAYILGNSGLITADVEYVDYSSIHFSSNFTSEETNTNRDIAALYKGNFNYRAGLELKVVDQFMVRGGYSYSGSPYKNLDFTTQSYSGGLGYRFDNYSLDVTYRHTKWDSTNSPYTISSDYPDFNFTGAGPTANLKNSADNVFLTFGVRF